MPHCTKLTTGSVEEKRGRGRPLGSTSYDDRKRITMMAVLRILEPDLKMSQVKKRVILRYKMNEQSPSAADRRISRKYELYGDSIERELGPMLARMIKLFAKTNSSLRKCMDDLIAFVEALPVDRMTDTDKADLIADTKALFGELLEQLNEFETPTSLAERILSSAEGMPTDR